MPKRATERLLRSARRQIDEWDVGISPDQFVCHVCLRLLPKSDATTGHYPSGKAGGGQYALQCRKCNNRIGSEVEAPAARFLRYDEWTLSLGPPGGRSIQLQVRLRSDGDVLSLLTNGKTKAWRKARSLAARSSRSDVLDAIFSRPHEDSLRLAILAWSYSEWTRYSNYSYSASAGAEYVRRLLLDGSSPIPDAAVVFLTDRPEAPIGTPEPVLVIQADEPAKRDAYVGIGVRWGDQVVGVLPAASDGQGRVYERLAALIQAKEPVVYVPLDPMLTKEGIKGLGDVLVIKEEEDGIETGWQMRVTDWVLPEDRERLARDQHPRRIDPVKAHRRAFPDGKSQTIFFVEDFWDDSTGGQVHTRRPTARREGKLPLGRVAVATPGSHVWHIATHIRTAGTRPRDYALFCGAPLAVADSVQRELNGIGLDGPGRVCSECVRIMTIKPASQRRRPPSVEADRHRVQRQRRPR